MLLLSNQCKDKQPLTYQGKNRTESSRVFWDIPQSCFTLDTEEHLWEGESPGEDLTHEN